MSARGHDRRGLGARSLSGALAGIVLVANVLFLTGCSTTPASTQENNGTSAENPPGEPSDFGPEVVPPTVTDCDSESLEAIHAVILEQAEALGNRDFEAAYALASPTFRDAVTPVMFERVITRQYDMLLFFEAAAFGPCGMIEANVAQMNVEIASSAYQPVSMLYDVIFVEGRWWVKGVDNPVSAVPNA